MATYASQVPQKFMSLHPTPSSPFPLGEAQSFELQCWLFLLGDLGEAPWPRFPHLENGHSNYTCPNVALRLVRSFPCLVNKAVV